MEQESGHVRYVEPDLTEPATPKVAIGSVDGYGGVPLASGAIIPHGTYYIMAGGILTAPRPEDFAAAVGADGIIPGEFTTEQGETMTRYALAAGGDFVTLADVKTALDALDHGAAPAAAPPKRADNLPVHTIIYPCSKLTQNLTKMLNGKRESFVVSGKTEPTERHTYATIWDTSTPEGARVLKKTDNLTIKACTALWNSGARTVELATVARVAYDCERATKGQKQTVEESMDRLLRGVLEVDDTESARVISNIAKKAGRGFDGTVTHSGAIVPHDKTVFARADGARCVIYTLLAPPFPYRHSRQFGQVISYGAEFVRELSSSAGRNGDMQALLRGAVLTRLRKARRGKLNPRITYEYLYEAVAEEPKSLRRAERQRIREATAKVLDALKDAGAIDGWETYRTKGHRGQTPSGVCLIISKKNTPAKQPKKDF